MSDTRCTDSLFINACRGIRGERVPVWFMRQAGRYLEEYRAVRKAHSMLDVIRTPELAAQVTLQPIDRFGFDAAIIFADILNPLIGMGIELDFVEGEGPVIGNPVRGLDDIRRLRVPDPTENTGYTLEAIRAVSTALAPRGVPLIGFSGAPLTLSAYLLEGGRVGNLERVKKLFLTEPAAWHELQEKLTALVSSYLIAQANAGAAALQLFDSWLGAIGPAQFDEFVAPYLKRIVEIVRASCDVPMIFFATGTAGLFGKYAELGFDVYGVDWRSSLPDAQRLIGERFPLQGNLDPLLLLGDRSNLDKNVRRILEESRVLKSHIFNLGHGILPPTPVDQVQRVLELVRGG